MKTLIILATLLQVSLVALLLLGCEDDEGGYELDSSHEGWGNPGCWKNDCHSEDDTHNNDLQPYECVDCHGKNGSPNGHNGSTPCGACHPDQHGNNGFPDPESCNNCH